MILDQLTIGSLVAFNGYVLMLHGPINSVNGLVNQWENAYASMEKVFGLLDQKPAIQSPAHPVKPQNITGHIEFRDVWFRYGDEDVLRDISLDLRAGTTTAIMGDTGAGKTTVINLIARFYDCTQGEVRIDGVDVRSFDLDNLRRNIGVILQETFLFSDTIAGNIAFANPEASQRDIEDAARIADAHEFIQDMPRGYETVIGERGIGLSGGQRQRIAIARAILSDPKILILDDATSSVDMETEHEIQQTLKNAMEGRTTLIVAHRISSVKEADEIVFLENGRIVERGTHDELVHAEGRYYDVFIEQYREYAQSSEGVI